MPVGPRPTTIPTFPWRTKSDWWVKNNRYFMYMVREGTAVFAALWVIVFLIQIPMMAGGVAEPRMYAGWLLFIHSPLWVIFSLVSFCFVMYHAVTFLGLMGTVMATRIGHLRVGGALVVGPMYLAWIGVTLLLILLILLIPQLGG